MNWVTIGRFLFSPEELRSDWWFFAQLWVQGVQRVSKHLPMTDPCLLWCAMDPIKINPSHVGIPDMDP